MRAGIPVTTCIYIKPLMLLLIMVIGVFTAFVVKHTGKRPNGRLEKAKEVNGNDRTLFLCLNELAGLTSTVIIMALAAYFAIKESFSAGIVIAFGQLSGKIISSIMTASDTWIRFKSSGKLTEKYKALLQDSEDTGSKREKQAVYGHSRFPALVCHKCINGAEHIAFVAGGLIAARQPGKPVEKRKNVFSEVMHTKNPPKRKRAIKIVM